MGTVDGKKKKKRDAKSKIGFVEEKTLLYFRRAADQLAQGFEDEEEKSAFAHNVFKETEKEEIKLARNQTISRILEQLLDVAERPALERFLFGFTENYHLVCTDRFASHVMQALIVRATELLNGQPESLDAETEESTNRKSMSTFVTELFNVTYGNLRDFVFETYASHVVRAFLLLLGGCDARDAATRSDSSWRTREKRRTPIGGTDFKPLDATRAAEYKPMLEKFGEKCLELGLPDLVGSDVAGPVLQAMLKALKNQKSPLAQTACRRLTKDCGIFDSDSPDRVPPSLENFSVCRLAEEIVAAMTKKQLRLLYKRRLSGRLAAMAESASANFVLQRFVRSIRAKRLFDLVAAEVLVSIERFVASPHRAVLVFFAEKCAEFRSNESEFMTALMRSMGCLEPSERRIKLAILLADFTPFDKIFADDKQICPVRVSLQGSLLLQRLFLFSDPRDLAECFVRMSPAYLIVFAKNPCGSHVFEAMFSSQGVDASDIVKMASRMRSSLVEMATDVHGSRVLDALWKRCALKSKREVAETLSKNLGRLSGDRYGKFVARNFRLEQFIMKRDAWMKWMEEEEKAVNVLEKGKGTKRKRQDDD